MFGGFQIRTLYRASTNSFRTLNPGISDLLVILKFLNNFLNTIRRIQQSADGGVVIQLVDDESDIFAQVAADVIFAGEKLRCLVYDVGGQNFCEESFLISLVEFLQSAGEQSEGQIGRASCRERVCLYV